MRFDTFDLCQNSAYYYSPFTILSDHINECTHIGFIS